MYPDPKLVIFTDGKKAVLPLSCQKRLKGLIKTYISSPAGTFGGWISLDDLDRKHGILLIEFLTQKLGNLVWRMNPYDRLAFKSEVQDSQEDETHTLNLKSGFDTIYEEWTKGHRSAARKARKAGIAVKSASSLNDWHDYYQIYEDSLRRWGDKASSKYYWEIFHEMFQRNSPNIKLWLAIFQEKIIAGALCFYAKKHVVYWHGAALENYFNLRPVNLLMYEVIKNACEQKYSWFDFNPSGGHEGVKAFKRSFGAEALLCPIIEINKLWIKVAKQITCLLKLKT
jgi:lipid II:glycine glycyltransferase (peptidoglycan interpeptide bridge formation enzyme)